MALGLSPDVFEIVFWDGSRIVLGWVPRDAQLPATLKQRRVDLLSADERALPVLVNKICRTLILPQKRCALSHVVLGQFT